jgi:leader peptidase (prepilin peptidase) / N-methyltransferase
MPSGILPIDPTAAALLASAPFVGGFLGTLVRRLADGEGEVWGRTLCPACHAPARPLDRLPVASWWRLDRTCSGCGAADDRLFVVIEIAALVVALWAAACLPPTEVAVGCGYGWTLLTLAAIDARRGILPDALTLPLGAAGLLLAGLAEPADLPARLLGVLAGYGAFYAVRELHWRMRRQEGLGLGDVKLLGAVGAWVSWQGLPSIVLLASLLGLAFALLGTTAGKGGKLEDRLPFGPCLCFSSWVVWLHGPMGFW